MTEEQQKQPTGCMVYDTVQGLRQPDHTKFHACTHCDATNKQIGPIKQCKFLGEPTGGSNVAV